MENVIHPKHYNGHPAGIECIDVIRHYTCDIGNAIKYLWRAGLKPEMGLSAAQKEIEDLRKAVFYIEDYAASRPLTYRPTTALNVSLEIVRAATGYDCRQITDGLNRFISMALQCLLPVGIIHGGQDCTCSTWRDSLDDAVRQIIFRIVEIESAGIKNDTDDLHKVINGEWVDGVDYVSKPGCVRETEPKKYDPLNMIVVRGTAYCLTDEIKYKYKDEKIPYSPCVVCDMKHVCGGSDGSRLCSLHEAYAQEYYVEVGTARYDPNFGVIAVVDELREVELELKELKELEELEE